MKVPKIVYFACLILAMAFDLIFFDMTLSLNKVILESFIFLLLTSTPYIMWVIHKEGQENAKYFQDHYGGSELLMWIIRIFMMVITSVLFFVAGLIVWGIMAFMVNLFYQTI